MPANYDVIATTTIGSPGSFSFGSIPQTYKELYLVGSGKSNIGSNQNNTMIVNGSTSSIYQSFLMYGQSSTAAMATNATAGTLYTALSGPTYFWPMTWRFVNYTDTNHFKTIIGWSGGADGGSFGQTRYEVNVARTTSAITSIDVGVNGGLYAAGSQLTLYGLV